MRGFNTVQKYLVRKLKFVPREDWVVRPTDAYIPFQERSIDNVDIKYFRDVKKQLKGQQQIPKEELRPCSPKMGPYRVINPKLHDKMYRWCACGQSLNQPFCDESHKGTSFKPVKFSIEQKVHEVNLCGCKLTSKKPFCDGQACKAAAPLLQDK